MTLLINQASSGVILDFSANLLLLFGTILLYQISRFKPKQKGWIKNGVVGVIIGLIGMMTMMFPFTMETGLIFDARSVLFTVSGYFFGPIVTMIGAIIAMAYRLSIGGGGMYAGLATITATSLIGIAWTKIELKLPRNWPTFFNLYLLGFIAHIATLLCQMLIIPSSNIIPAIRNVAIPFLVFYPLAVVILGLSIENHKKRLQAEESILRQKLLLQSSIDSAEQIEIYALDLNYNYLSFNKFHADSMTRYYGKTPSIGDNFLSFVVEDSFRKRLKREIETAIKGKSLLTEAEIEVSPGKFFESHYNPIIDKNGHIIGVGVFAQEITNRIKNEQEILHLSYHDSLTGLKNRRFYQEELDRLESDPNRVYTFAFFDINGLKVMNDAFGHHTGDHLLKLVCATVSNHLPDNATLIRIGGDEFFIIFYDMHEDAVLPIIDSIDHMISKESINSIRLSVSFGVQEHHPKETIMDSIRYAEKKMYNKKLSEVTSSRHETIRAILNTLHVKSNREESHSIRVSLICQKIGEAMKFRREELELLKLMATLHDIGKIAIDQSILDKRGPLTEQEWFEIKKHPETGYHILLASPEYAEIAEDILSHHERFDGKGYPRGLKGKDIPIRARIISLADSYDAMTSDRPYRDAMTPSQAYEEIKRNIGTQFDPDIATLFLQLLDQAETPI